MLVSKRKVKIMFSTRFDGKQTSYFPLLAKVPIKMRKYGQQMWLPSHAMSVAKNIGL